MAGASDDAGRFGPASAAVVRAVAKRLMPDGEYSPEQIDLAAAVLMPAIVSGETSITLHAGNTSRRGADGATGVVEVRTRARLVATFDWADLDLHDDTALRRPTLDVLGPLH